MLSRGEAGTHLPFERGYAQRGLRGVACLAEDGTDAHATESDTEALTATLVGGGATGTVGLASSSDLGGGLWVVVQLVGQLVPGAGSLVQRWQTALAAVCFGVVPLFAVVAGALEGWLKQR